MSELFANSIPLVLHLSEATLITTNIFHPSSTTTPHSSHITTITHNTTININTNTQGLHSTPHRPHINMDSRLKIDSTLSGHTGELSSPNIGDALSVGVSRLQCEDIENICNDSDGSVYSRDTTGEIPLSAAEPDDGSVYSRNTTGEMPQLPASANLLETSRPSSPANDNTISLPMPRAGQPSTSSGLLTQLPEDDNQPVDTSATSSTTPLSSTLSTCIKRIKRWMVRPKPTIISPPAVLSASHGSPSSAPPHFPDDDEAPPQIEDSLDESHMTPQERRQRAEILGIPFVSHVAGRKSRFREEFEVSLSKEEVREMNEAWKGEMAAKQTKVDGEVL
ncbi:hypothetical protein DFH27DRAFT_644907 [Peziza echinospora]|nr:hypothetical protein DFH27DRAFT_644907 [Peziza echinospora]